MALKETVFQKLMNEVILPLQVPGEWKVLVLDRLSTRMVSACCKMHQIMDEGITLVEDINKRREPLPMVAIYLISPTKKSIQALMSDFSGSRLYYAAAHVFFTEACPDELFNELCKSPAAKHLKTLKEISLAFVPYENCVFSLDSPESTSVFFHPRPRSLPFRGPHLERLACQLATLCAAISEYPPIRYHSWMGAGGSGPNGLVEHCAEFAQLVQQKLDACKADDPSMGAIGAHKERTQLILVDRGMDPVSPLLHELSFQAMCYDLLEINNDVYKYLSISGSEDKEVILDENDELWKELRHLHIAVVSQKVTEKLKAFADEKTGSGGHPPVAAKQDPNRDSMRDLSQLLKKIPQYQSQLSNYATHFHLAEDCMRAYQGHVDKLCRVEQDLAMGMDAEGERIREHMRLVVPILLDQTVTAYDKVRIILLYIVLKGGISEEHLMKLVQHGQIPDAQKAIITNTKLIGVPVLQESVVSTHPAAPKETTSLIRRGLSFRSSRRKRVDPNFSDVAQQLSQAEREEAKRPNTRKKAYQPYLVANRRESPESKYHMSRWTPYLKDVLEDAIDDRLDSRQFPYLGGAGVRSTGVGLRTTPTSARYGQWHHGGRSPTHSSTPRLIVFVLGGLSFSEIRSAYEVSRSRGWEIIIGSTHLATPEQFLADLEKMSSNDHRRSS